MGVQKLIDRLDIFKGCLGQNISLMEKFCYSNGYLKQINYFQDQATELKAWVLKNVLRGRSIYLVF